MTDAMRDQDRVAVLEIVAKHCGKTSSMYRYIRDDVAALQSQQDGAQGGEAVASDEWVCGLYPILSALGDADFGTWESKQAYDAALNYCAQRLSRPAIAPQATPATVDDAMAWLTWIAGDKPEVRAIRSHIDGLQRRLDWIAMHGTFAVDSVTGEVGGNGAKHLAATQENIDAALAAPPAEVKP